MKKTIIALLSAVAVFVGGCICAKNECPAAKNEKQIKVGWAKNDITPLGPTFLGGQMFPRFATEVHDPLFTSAMAVESGNEKFIMISLDSVGFRQPLMDKVREKVSAATGIPVMNIIGFAIAVRWTPFQSLQIQLNDFISRWKRGIKKN